MAEQSTDILNAFALEFDQTFFYSYFLQIILVTYMFCTVGHGKYWKVLFFGSVLGFFGALMEHIFQAYQSTLPEEEKYTTNVSILLFIAEIGWITTEFSVPILNLIKLNSLSHVKLVKVLNFLTVVLFCGFTFFRLEIGYYRFTEHRVGCTNCNAFHSQAFGVMAITDIILSIMIFYRINKSNREYKVRQNNENIPILNTFRNSSVFSLLIIDVISVFLSLTYIFNSTKDYAKPFHALKSNFLLILAVDSFIFKFKATNGSSTIKSNENSRSRNGTYSMNGACSTYYKQTKTILNRNSISMVKTNSVNNISSFNLASSQPIALNNSKNFGLLSNKCELIHNNDTEINIEIPKPSYIPSSNNDY
ncbi:hypothetical protein BCR36DRAFT_579317 [Piromyces finnis]|uniref:Uncharacterized protein n=1 Tax=Piromyces finnis TaxID=1754191 RepID=A0A1Y1VLQ9_9FUNG|nr:hypothetical protein BCR36DRAFT_579317 [Piromyces finnis]|eukprot:ORX59867.1 hypothetical protein BCR36DRAFT_579317 [Piromyces finnis]